LQFYGLFWFFLRRGHSETFSRFFLIKTSEMECQWKTGHFRQEDSEIRELVKVKKFDSMSAKSLSHHGMMGRSSCLAGGPSELKRADMTPQNVGDFFCDRDRCI
jgi:hypothetical protein